MIQIGTCTRDSHYRTSFQMKHWIGIRNRLCKAGLIVFMPKGQTVLVCNAFDHKNGKTMITYGTDEVKLVFHHFQPVLENANCDLNVALGEFTELKLHVTRNPQMYQRVHPL
ncbi:hypothetical protein MAR_021401, partial [Mya arenaria]